MCTPPPIRSSPTDGRTDSFSPSILSSSRKLFNLADFNCHHPPWDSRSTSDPNEEKVFDWFFSSDLLPSMTLTHPLFSIAPPPTFSLLPPLLPFLGPGRCFRTWVLTTYQSFYPSLSPRSFASTSVPLHSTSRKLSGMTLYPTLTPTVLLQRNTRLFLFPLLLLSFPLWH